MRITATELRRNVYRLLDQVLDGDEVVEIERGGRLLRISRVDERPRSLRIRPIPDMISGDPGDLDHIDWSNEWRP